VNGPCYGEEHEHSAGSSAWMCGLSIDGTATFVLGHLHWVTLIGLNDGTRPVLGVAYQPFVGEFFLGSSAGAELRRGTDRRKLRTRRCPRLAEAAYHTCTSVPSQRGPLQSAWRQLLVT
jgi:fructose-1,6-bisphosphatase/inositol monophosphatase family enzyme